MVHAPRSLVKRMSCSSLVGGLLREDCSWLASIGVYSQGINSYSNNGIIWIGSDGPNLFHLGNTGSTPITAVVWHQPTVPIDYKATFMAARQPYVTISIAAGKTVTISVANGISGAMAGVKRGKTALTQWGQIDQTWMEFSTESGWGPNYATMGMSPPSSLYPSYISAFHLAFSRH